MLRGLLSGGLGAQTRPVLSKMKRLISDEVAKSYVNMHYPEGDKVARNANEARVYNSSLRTAMTLFAANTVADEDTGRIIINTPLIVAQMEKYGLRPMQEEHALAIALLSQKRINDLGIKGGFDGWRGGVAFFVEDPIYETPVEEGPRKRADFAREAIEEAARKAFTEYQEASRYFRPDYEINLVDPRAERKTLHGLRRR